MFRFLLINMIVFGSLIFAQEYPVIHTSNILWIEEVARSDYSIYVPVHTADGIWRETFIFNDLDNYTKRIDRYRHGFVTAIMQPELTQYMMDQGKNYKILKEYAARTSNSSVVSNNLNSLLDVLLGAEIAYSFSSSNITSALSEWENIVSDETFKSTLHDLGSALSLVNTICKISTDALQNIIIHALTNSMVKDRIDCFDYIFANETPPDDAIIAGYNLAKSDVMTFIEDDYNILKASLDYFKDNGADYIVDGIKLLPQIAANLHVISGSVASSISQVVLPYYLSYKVATQLFTEVEAMQVLCTIAYLNEWMLDWIDAEYLRLPNTNDSNYPIARKRFLNATQIRYGIGFSYNAKYYELLEHKGSFVDILDWIKFLVQNITGVYEDIIDFCLTVLKPNMIKNYDYTMEIMPYYDFTVKNVSLADLSVDISELSYGEIDIPRIKRVNLYNNGDTDLSWQTSTSYNWISFSNTSGTLSPGGVTAVYITIDPRSSGVELGESFFGDFGIENTADLNDYKTIYVSGRYGSNSPPRLDFDDIYTYTPYDIFEGDSISFVATYSDRDGDPPAYVLIYIDGDGHFMIPKGSGDFQTGVDYIYTTDKLSLGAHAYHFYCEDINGGIEQEPYSGEFSDLYIYATEPTIELTSPVQSTPQMDSLFEIEWNANYAEKIDLYYDNDTDPTSGLHLITKDLSNSGSYNWDISAIDNGSYFIYAIAKNIQGMFEDDYSAYPLRINHSVFRPNEQWLPPYKFEQSIGQRFNAVRVDDWGVLHIYWATRGIIHVSSMDNGLTFSEPETLFAHDGTDITQVFDVAMDGMHTAILFYKSGSGLMSIASHDSNITWSSPISIADDFGYIAGITKSNGKFFVAHLAKPGSSYDLQVKVSNNHGDSWSSIGGTIATDIEPETINNRHSLGISAVSGDLYVVYSDRVDRNVWVRKSTDGGSGWSSPVAVLGSNFQRGRLPSIHANEYGVFVFTQGRHDGPTSYNFCAYSHDAGSNWDYTSISTNGIDGKEHKVATAGSTLLYVDDDLSSYIKSKDGGVTWSEVSTICDTLPSDMTDLLLDDQEIYYITRSSYIYFIRTVPPNTTPQLTIQAPMIGIDTVNNDYLIKWKSLDNDHWQSLRTYIGYSNDTIGTPVIPIAVDSTGDSTYSWDVSRVPSDIYYIHALVDDGEGGFDSKYSLGQIYVNHSPTLAFGVDGIDTVNSSYDLVVDAIDLDQNDTLKLSLFFDTDTSDVDMDTIIIDTSLSSNINWNTSELPEALYYLYGQITDGINDVVSTYSAGQVYVLHNDPPYCLFADPLSRIEVTEGDTLEFNVIAVDPESATVSYAWYINGNTAFGEDDSVLVLYSSTLGSGQDTIRLEYTDGIFTRNISWYLTVSPQVGIDEHNKLISWTTQSTSYPQPCRGTVEINLTGVRSLDELNLEIFNAEGQLIYSGIFDTGDIQWSGTNDHGDFVNGGVYYYKVSSGNYVWSGTLMMLE